MFRLLFNLSGVQPLEHNRVQAQIRTLPDFNYLARHIVMHVAIRLAIHEASIWRESGSLTLPNFFQCFAINAQLSSGSCLKAAYSNFNATGFAIPVLIIVDTLLRFIDFLNQLAFPVTRSEFETEFFFLRRPVVGVWKVGCIIFHVVHGAIYFFHQLLFPFRQFMAEMGKLIGVHVVAVSLVTNNGGSGAQWRWIHFLVVFHTGHRT